MRWKTIDLLVFLIMSVSAIELHAQKVSMPAWQTAAGGTVEFEVVSIHKDAQGAPFRGPSFALSADDWFREPNGSFHADFSVETYVEFAYKLWLTSEERRAAFAGVPDWVKNDRYTIEAKAPLHATKDQYRLMMQAMLRDRFGLKVHFEDREMPVLAMELVKAGKPGPNLIPHDRGTPCDAHSTDVFPQECYTFAITSAGNGLFKGGSRAISMDLVGKFLGNIGGASGEVSRPAVDRTGLNGLWDFSVVCVQSKAPGAADAENSTAGPTLLEAVREQLGIKLVPTKARLPELVVEHVDRLSEN